jgi:hypothetical protein
MTRVTYSLIDRNTNTSEAADLNLDEVEQHLAALDDD